MAVMNKVLAVDDAQLMQTMYGMFFKEHKEFSLVKAMNGLEALEIVTREEDIALILLDINMPVMNGIQFMEKVKEQNLCEGIPIIIVSTEGSEEDAQKALELGASNYIVKPFKVDELFEKIKKALKQAKTDDSE
jgi:two-component system chemotaxis response regulator CheY